MIAAAFVFLSAALLVGIGAVVHRVLTPSSPPEAREKSLKLMVGGILWVGAWLGVAATGLLARTDLTPPPFAAVLVLVVVVAVAFTRSGYGQALARAPIGALIGLQAFRLPLELAMASAATQGLMPMQMSLHGRNFDVVTGVLASVIGVWATFRPVPRAAAWAFQTVGLVLLFNIVGVAVASTPMIHAFGEDPAVVNTFVFHPPFVLLPTVLVAGALILHLALARRLVAP